MKLLITLFLTITTAQAFAQQRVESFKGSALAVIDNAQRDVTVNIEGFAAVAMFSALRNAKTTKTINDSVRMVTKEAGTVSCLMLNMRIGEINGTPVYSEPEVRCAISIDAEKSVLKNVLN